MLYFTHIKRGLFILHKNIIHEKCVKYGKLTHSLVKLEEKCEERLKFYGSHDPLELVKHPTALYSMYKRWAGLKESNTTAGCYNSTDIKAMMPDKDDLTEMGLNLVRLQFTYNLSVSEMMSGNISGRMSPWPLDVSDCLRIADITHEDMKPDGFNVWHSACSAMEGRVFFLGI